jgi:hypothetical protein
MGSRGCPVSVEAGAARTADSALLFDDPTSFRGLITPSLDVSHPSNPLHCTEY